MMLLVYTNTDLFELQTGGDISSNHTQPERMEIDVEQSDNGQFTKKLKPSNVDKRCHGVVSLIFIKKIEFNIVLVVRHIHIFIYTNK